VSRRTLPSRPPGTPTRVGGSRGFWPLRDLPAVLWLVATVAAGFLHTAVPAPRWLLIHLLLLGAVSHSILVWSRHFADALLHTPARLGERRPQSARLALLNGGTLLVVVGVLTGTWPVTSLGAAAIAGAALWHGGSLLAQLRAALPARFAMTVRYYVAAAALLPVGALLGTLMARGTSDRTHERMLVAHVSLNVLGWLGLTVLGTLVTLWPTMLRTRIASGAERAASRALPVLLAGVTVTVAAALTGVILGTALGLALYLVGLGVLAGPFARAARAKPPSSFPTSSVLAGLLWLAGTLVLLTGTLATSTTWSQAHGRLTDVTPALAAGFAAQVLLGALSYLMPVALGGGPAAVRAANQVLDRGGPLRLALVNLGLLASLPPVPSTVRALGALLALGGFAAFLPLMSLAARASRRAKAGTAPAPSPRPPGQGSALAVLGLTAVLLAVAVGVAADPAAVGGTQALPASAGVAATGRTTQVDVAADHMRFTPSRIEVQAGNRLVITLRNADTDTVHDLVLDSGAKSGRLAPGATARVDAGVVGRDLVGWCSVAGHRQMGMVLDVVVLGGAKHAELASPGSAADNQGGGHGGDQPGTPRGSSAPGPSGDAAGHLDFMRAPGSSFTAHPAQLAPASATRMHRLTLTVEEVVREVSPGVTQRLWAYNGSVPGPVLHGVVGDVFEVTLVNEASIGHSIDFHAGALAPDEPMRTIPPGGSLVYTFTATRAGIWMYHCSSMPMSAHIANGLFGAVIIDPPGLRPVAHQYVLLQSELYLGAQGGSVDVDKVNAERPDAVAFNGYANQYDHDPLTARVGERVRIWVLDAGPNRASAFHVVGGQFDTVYSEGNYLLHPGPGGAQVLSLAPAQGGFVELSFPEAGHYPFVSHVMVDAERGAHGIITVAP
jgi:nitrite reductase (NO-forming)